MTETEHTPTPWKYQSGIIRTDKGADSTVIATMGVANSQATTQQKITDAEFIVLACNVHDDLMKSAKNAVATISAIYEWLDRVEKAGGATSMSGIASCHTMLTSLRKNAKRTDDLVMAPLRVALAKAGAA